MFRYARIKHDNPPRQSNSFRVYPETVPMGNSPKDGKGVVIPYTSMWESWTRSINTTESGDWLFTPHTMLFNIDYTETPLGESITNSGNAVRVIEETSEFVKISHWRNDVAPPVAVNYFNRPFLVQKVCCMDRETLQLRKPDDGKDVYFPIISKGSSELWITKSRIEPFPVLPVRVAVTISSLPVYRNPSFSAGIITELDFLEEIYVTEYRLRGGTVWGKVTGEYWICLQHGKVFNTSWRMETLPPP